MADYFDLRELAREVLDTSVAVDPATLAKEVSLRIGRHDQAAALEQALPTFVHHMITRSRHSASPGGHASLERQQGGAVHRVPCHRCGPAGRPALIGSPLSDGHKDARALRLVAKAVLRDLWMAARTLHGD